MKCKDCKHCAYVNDVAPRKFTTIDSDGTEYDQFGYTGSYCMFTNVIMYDVQQCPAYEKRNLKIKQ